MKWYWFSVWICDVRCALGNFSVDFPKWKLSVKFEIIIDKSQQDEIPYGCFQVFSISCDLFSPRLPFSIIDDWSRWKWLKYVVLVIRFRYALVFTIAITSFYSIIWWLVVRAPTSILFSFALLCFVLISFLLLKSSSPRWITIDHTCSLKMIRNSTGFNVSMSTQIGKLSMIMNYD